MEKADSKLWFPDPSQATKEGIIAYGGDLSADRLLLAYRSGIFPWYEEGEPIIWWSPNPRMVLNPLNLKISKSLKKIIESGRFEVTFNQEFRKVIDYCATIKRKGQRGTWITEEMKEAYIELHDMGFAMSVEVWENKKLVGGLYGVDIKEKRIFSGESMFSLVTNSSKIGFVSLVKQLYNLNYKLIDCQVYTSHLESLGAEEIERSIYLDLLNC